MLIIQQAGHHFGIVQVLRITAKAVQEPEVLTGGMYYFLNGCGGKEVVQPAQFKTGQRINNITFIRRCHLYQAKGNAITVTVIIELKVKADRIALRQVPEALLQAVLAIYELNGCISVRWYWQQEIVLACKNKGPCLGWLSGTLKRIIS